MSRSRIPPIAKRQRWRWFPGVILIIIAGGAVLWVSMDRGKSQSSRQAGVSREPSGKPMEGKKPRNDKKTGVAVDTTTTSGSSRRPLQFRAKPVEPAAVLGVLATGKQTVEERVRQLQGMRGISLSNDERESALSFLSGKEVPEGIGKGSMQWLADELLTVMRLQEPPWDGLAADLAKTAFQSGIDPVVRDYIMQHLGHLWEQYGAREEIETALWKAVGTPDETTPGTALIALSRGYTRDQRDKDLAEVRKRAFELARNPATGLAVRVTALSIAGESGGREVKELANGLAKNTETPVILRKVAENVAEK